MKPLNSNIPLHFSVQCLAIVKKKPLVLEGLRPFLFRAPTGLLPFLFHSKHPNLNETSHAKQKPSVQPGAEAVPGRALAPCWSPSISSGLCWHGGGCPLPGHCRCCEGPRHSCSKGRFKSEPLLGVSLRSCACPELQQFASLFSIVSFEGVVFVSILR